MAFCGKCGKQLEEGVKFCPKCGQPTSIASQQQVNQPQQQYIAQGQQQVKQPQQPYVVQEGEETSFGSKLKKHRNSKWYWIAASVVFVIIIATNMGGCSDTDMLQKEVQKLMVDKMKEKGQTLKINDFTLVHQNDNIYTGLASCILDGKKMDLDVNVVYDGNSFQAEWAPTAEYQQKALEDAFKEAEKEFDKAQKELENDLNKLFDDY